MKKLVALLLAVLMLSMSVLALAEAPEGYPEVVEGIDFGGRTVSIYSWYDNIRSAEPTDEEQALYDYQDWIETTYNVNVEWVVPYDWAGSIQYLTDFVTNKNSDLVIFTMPMDFIGPALKNNLLTPWNDLVDTTNPKWNQGTVEFMTMNGNVLGLWNGASEPRECVFFNKQLLRDANIDPETIYDMQADGTWTFDALLDLCAKVQQDKDNDGVVDVWATTGSGDDLILGAIYGNGGTVYQMDENGKMTLGLTSENTIEALTFVQTIRNTYFRKAMTDADGNTENWDYYKTAFAQGEAVFRFGQTWEGYNGNEAMNAAGFEWGCVAFPTGPKSEPGAYISVVNDNITCIPNVYSAEDAKLLGFLWDVWTNPTPGYEDDDEAWIGNKYNYTDDRAVDETYALMREPEHTARDPYILLGDKNTVLGPDLFWQIDNMDAAALVESVKDVFQSRADDFNK